MIIAIDDGYFPAIKKGKTTIASVLWYNFTPARITVEYIDIDGSNGTDVALKILRDFDVCRHSTVVILDGIAYAGFNYIDPDTLRETCKVNYIVFFYRPLDIEKVRSALQKNFIDWEKRFEVFKRAQENAKVIHTFRGKAFVYTNLQPMEAHRILSGLQFYSRSPEPLRIAHLIASEASKFLRRRDVLR